MIDFCSYVITRMGEIQIESQHKSTPIQALHEIQVIARDVLLRAQHEVTEAHTRQLEPDYAECIAALGVRVKQAENRLDVIEAMIESMGDVSGS